ncbi:MAG: TonB-dependent receptor [Alistipes sp.]|nr:TonB-dependent receptor [Alistipes sp.]
MRRHLLMFVCLLCGSIASAQQDTHPLYIVNGRVWQSVAHIPEENIEKIETLSANEESVAKYGEQANNGVVIITLCYDRAARFHKGEPFADYIASQVKWKASDPAARYVVRYTIETNGSLTLGDELESTDRVLRKRVIKAITNAPSWQPATKAGVPVKSDYVLSIQLPKGKSMPRERYIVLM